MKKRPGFPVAFGCVLSAKTDDGPIRPGDFVATCLFTGYPLVGIVDSVSQQGYSARVVWEHPEYTGYICQSQLQKVYITHRSL